MSIKSGMGKEMLLYLEPDTTEQDEQSFLIKVADSKYFQLWLKLKPYSLCCNSTLPPWCKSSCRQYRNKSAWQCFNKALLAKQEIGLLLYSNENEQTTTTCNNMVEFHIMLSKRSQIQENTHGVIPFIQISKIGISKLFHGVRSETIVVTLGQR